MKKDAILAADVILGTLFGALLHYLMYNATYWAKIGIPQGDIYPGIPIGYDTLINLGITGAGALLLPSERFRRIFGVAFWFILMFQISQKMIEMGIGRPAA